MMAADTITPFIQSPLAVTLIGVACVTMVTITGAAIQIVVRLARMEATVKDIRDDIVTLKNDPDVMRWSNYGRMNQAALMQQGTPGAKV